MATYAELFQLSRGNPEQFKYRLHVAIARAQGTVRAENPNTANHANRLLWSKLPAESLVETMLWDVIWSSQVQAAGTAVTDANLQAAVDGLVDKFATG